MNNLPRSSLLVPADDPKLDQALTWEPDAISLDLADLVHPSRLANARISMANNISLIASNGAIAMARIDITTVDKDLIATIHPGLSAVLLNGIERAEEVTRMEPLIGNAEALNGVPQGTVKLIPFLTTARGLYNTAELAGSSPRVAALAIGSGDLAFDLLPEQDKDMFFYTGPNPRISSPEFLITRTTILGYRQARIGILGVLGTTIAPGYANEFSLLQAATRARKLGLKGAFTFHREGIRACNKGFSPTQIQI